LVASFILVVLLLPACGDSADTTLAAQATEATTTTKATAVEDQPVVVTEKDVVYAIWQEGALAYEGWEEMSLTLDMYAPAEAGGAPIVIYLPGRGETDAPTLLVDGLVEEGMIVFVVRYARSKAGGETMLRDGGVVVRAKAESVACAIRFAREQASERDSADPVVVLTGFSSGGGLAAHGALFGDTLEARWDEHAAEGGPPRQVECEVTEGSTHVDALVGMAGIYDVFVPIYDGRWGRAYQQEHDPALWQFLSASIGANPDLTVRLIHGTNDEVISYENSVEFATMLTDAGYDVGEVIAFAEGEHLAPAELAVPTIMEIIGP
jgi:acetyl esterase/lipase